jgi:hypothetical protein
MALGASRTQNRPNDGDLDFNGDGDPDTFQEIAQDAVDWLAFAQADLGQYEGGWDYSAQNNEGRWADNSNSGYAVLGLAYGEDLGCTVPGWVRTELNVWIDYIQCGAADDRYGGSGYDLPCSWVNELKTGNLIFEMTFVGDDPENPPERFLDALDYIERHWDDPGGCDTGWLDHRQAMYCLMKGLEYSQIDLLDTDDDGDRDDDWFDEVATRLIATQNPDGSWPGDCWGDQILSTTWALLTLEKIIPNQPPDCSNAYPSVDTLWPPNHKFWAVDVLGVTDPDDDPVSIVIDGIWQDEPVDTYGDGKFTPDGMGVGESTAEVRAERAGTKKVPGNGRVYHLFFTADDGRGGTCEGEVLIGVPHDVKDTPVDDGALYDSTALAP